MAASARTTPAPAPTTRAVGPAAASVAIAYAVMRSGSPTERNGLGCIILEDGPVFFDINRYPAIGEPIVVVFGDGRVEVATMPDSRNEWRSAHSPNLLMIDAGRPWSRHQRAVREQATLIGVVRR